MTLTEAHLFGIYSNTFPLGSFLKSVGNRICNCISDLLSITYLKQQILQVIDSKQ